MRFADPPWPAESTHVHKHATMAPVDLVRFDFPQDAIAGRWRKTSCAATEDCLCKVIENIVCRIWQ